jgi:hypothetical protein
MFKLNQQFNLFLLLDILVTLFPVSYFLSFTLSKQYIALSDPYHTVNYVFSYLGFLMFLFNIALISTGVFFTLKHTPPREDQFFRRAFIEGSKIYLVIVWIVCLVLLHIFFSLKHQVF